MSNKIGKPITEAQIDAGIRLQGRRLVSERNILRTFYEAVSDASLAEDNDEYTDRVELALETAHCALTRLSNL